MKFIALSSIIYTEGEFKPLLRKIEIQPNPRPERI